jgi:hypothetical protein
MYVAFLWEWWCQNMCLPHATLSITLLHHLARKLCQILSRNQLKSASISLHFHIKSSCIKHFLYTQITSRRAIKCDTICCISQSSFTVSLWCCLPEAYWVPPNPLTVGDWIFYPLMLGGWMFGPWSSNCRGLFFLCSSVISLFSIRFICFWPSLTSTMMIYLKHYLLCLPAIMHVLD